MVSVGESRTGVAYDRGYAPFEPKVAFLFSSALPVSSRGDIADIGVEKYPPDRSVCDAGPRDTVRMPLTSEVARCVSADEIAPLSEYQWSGPLRRQPVKRAFDIVLSSLLLIGLAPLMLAVAVALRLQDSGAILVQKQRIGRLGQPFGLLTFRTLTAPASGGVAARQGRLPLGRFLHRSGIEDLPLLLNIVRGELSFVGPRPTTAANLPGYGINVIYYLRERPGITGLWRVPGRTDAAPAACGALDREYGRTRNFSADLKVLATTLPDLLSGRGAL